MKTLAVLVVLLALFASIAVARGGSRRCTTRAQKKAFKQAAKAGNGEGTRLCVCITYCACVVASCGLYESYICE